MHSSFIVFPNPRNLNYWWTFGGILSFMLVAQIVTGVVLAMHYTPEVSLAFTSVEHIMRDVNYGWLLRYAHANGASMFFLAVYIHMLRGLYYGSYKSPREVLWILGVIIYLLMMATGFMGYVLPWGQMSFWGATVITSLFSAIPLVGDQITTWLWGGFCGRQCDAEPLLLAALSPALHDRRRGRLAHLGAACDGLQQSDRRRGEIGEGHVALPSLFHHEGRLRPRLLPHLLCLVRLLCAELSRPWRQLQEANPLQTPAHIVPEWYYLPFYAILRSIPSKLGGVVAMFSAIVLFAFLPWLDTSKSQIGRLSAALSRSSSGSSSPACSASAISAPCRRKAPIVTVGRILTTYYFLHFLVILPLLGFIETPRPLPASIAEFVLGAGPGNAGSAAAI